MKKIKYIKPKDDSRMLLNLQYVVMQDTNSPLIGMAIHRLCQKFIKDIKEIPLSDELQ